jgi:hypothetical protein
MPTRPLGMEPWTLTVSITPPGRIDSECIQEQGVKVAPRELFCRFPVGTGLCPMAVIHSEYIQVIANLFRQSTPIPAISRLM